MVPVLAAVSPSLASFAETLEFEAPSVIVGVPSELDAAMDVSSCARVSGAWVGLLVLPTRWGSGDVPVRSASRTLTASAGRRRSALRGMGHSAHSRPRCK